MEAPTGHEYLCPSLRSRVRYSDELSSRSSTVTDPEKKFYRKRGYLPPIDDPTTAKDHVRIGPEDERFPEGLDQRNVSLEQPTVPDPCEDTIISIKTQEFFTEDTRERESHERLWNMDRTKCEGESNEALFQRTTMMNLIARHWLIYDRGSSKTQYLDFSVEEPWTCPPMPTRAYWRGTRFLAQPKPDLPVSFRREALIPIDLWRNLPSTTKRLASYQGTDVPKRDNVFHFFTIEAQKGVCQMITLWEGFRI